METTNGYKKLKPTFSDSFGHGWDTMFRYFLILFLVVLVVGIILAPSNLLSFHFDSGDFDNWISHLPGIHLFTLGAVAAVMGLLALAYIILIVPVFRYGGKMMFLQAVRDIRPDFNMLIQGFRENYLTIVLASLLTFALIGLGTVVFLIPGIIVACRLAFVGYLVMDKKLDAIMAVEQSWKMTKGHGWTIFSMAIVSFFIWIAGLCLVVVGIFPATIWINGSFASLYEAALQEKEARQAENAPLPAA